MTDHLEPYRRMVRSMRFFPPISLTQPSQRSVPGLVTPAPVVNISSKTTIPDAHVEAALGPPIDPSEHTAALVHEAVCKPTVLPVTYTILENIGDRISRLAAPKAVEPVIIQPKLPQADSNWTPAHTIEAVVTQPVEVEQTSDEPVTEAIVAEPVEVEQVSDKQATEAIVAEPVEVEQTSDEQATQAVVAEPAEVQETLIDTSENNAPIDAAPKPLAVTETTSDNTSNTDTPAAEAEDTQAPTLLERVSSVIEAVSTAFINPGADEKESETVEAPAQLDSTDTQAPKADTVELLASDAPADEAEEAQAPTLLERVSSVVEAVTTTLKNSDTDQKNSEATVAPAPVVDGKGSDSKTEAITCPKCESTEIRKNGRRQGKQRYVCKDCGREFMGSDSAKAQDKPKSEESSPVETSKTKPSQSDTVTSDSTPESAKRQSKKKTKAKGFGGSKAK